MLLGPLLGNFLEDLSSPYASQQKRYDKMCVAIREGRGRRHQCYGSCRAGCSQQSAAEETSSDVATQMLHLNTLSPIALTRAALPAMLQVRSLLAFQNDIRHKNGPNPFD